MKSEIIKKLEEHNMTQEELASKIGITRKTLYFRLQNPDDFKLGELKKIKYILGIITEDFFNSSIFKSYETIDERR
ncbi:MAG: helix-turn-helix transcriptional regulator [Veillonella caviae]|nr:helix-turn-helix transcriptional regulator [Veillonella caviae]